MGAVTAPIPKPTTIPIAPPAASASTTSSAVGSTAAPQPAPVAVHAWEAVVSIDPKLDTDPDPSAPCPQGEPERIFPLDLAENLIGRRDDKNNIRPQIPLNDPGASRRHAKLLCAPDGTLALQDLASANGTTVNNQEVPAGTKRSLAAGDAITLGRWTRIVVRDRT
jgi:pSer/pThr/pTyr-binding forkhead associated (FHA) protein